MPKLTDAELAMVLVGLRLAQTRVRHQLLEDFRDYFEDSEPLTVEQIDELCERLNGGAM